MDSMAYFRVPMKAFSGPAESKYVDRGMIRNMDIPDRKEFLRGCAEFEKHEKRDAMYKVATFLVSSSWGKPADMADGLGVLLLTWNQAFYRAGSFDFSRLEKCIAKNLKKIDNFRKRGISSLSRSDEEDIRKLFNRFLDALRIDSGKNTGRRSPVGVAKALHLLAPNFFPLWDASIERAYGCYDNEKADEKYVAFCWISKAFASEVKKYVNRSDKTVLKLIDEYNYSKYTQGWI